MVKMLVIAFCSGGGVLPVVCTGEQNLPHVCRYRQVVGVGAAG